MGLAEVGPAAECIAALRAVPGRHLVLTQDLRISLASHQYLAWVGRSRRQVEGALLSQLLPDTVCGLVERSARQALTRFSTEELVLDRYLPHIAGGCRVTHLPLKDEDGMLLGLLHCVEPNIQNLTETAELLRKSNAELQHFAYIAAHDLQEPLRTISVYTELLAERYGHLADADAGQFTQYVVSAANRMQNLIQDLLEYSLLSKPAERPFQRVSIGHAIQAAAKNLQNLVESSGAVIDCGEVPEVLGDRTLLVLLFQNLFSNAIKYRRGAPFIRIEAQEQPDEWLFTVSDNGIGIERRYWDKIFEVFRRLHGPEIPGTGIGLALCRRIVERHGGKIWVTSVPGQGSSFHFTLRRDAQAPQTVVE